MKVVFDHISQKMAIDNPLEMRSEPFRVHYPAMIDIRQLIYICNITHCFISVLTYNHLYHGVIQRCSIPTQHFCTQLLLTVIANFTLLLVFNHYLVFGVVFFCF